MIFSTSIIAQDEPYSFTFAPDLWYNDVDGIRVGIRTLGEVEGTFNDGPHRLDAGLWVGTWFPKNPFSYYINFVEPIPFISPFGSEGNVELELQNREGFKRRKISLNKRFQKGFNEYNYFSFSLSYRSEKRFIDEYSLYPQYWSSFSDKFPREPNFATSNPPNWNNIFDFGFIFSRVVGGVSSKTKLNYLVSTNKSSGSFFNEGFWRINFETENTFKYLNDNSLRLRFFNSYMSKFLPLEYIYSYSGGSNEELFNKGLTRSEGILPSKLVDEGFFHFSGGTNLRGYVKDRFTGWTNNTGDDGHTTDLLSSINLDFDIPNPIDNKLNNTIIGDFISFKSYLFSDAALFMDSPVSGVLLTDIGIGFSLNFNIPDYLGNRRGFFVRYELPLFIPEPYVILPSRFEDRTDTPVYNFNTESGFKFRQLIGIGAIISF